MLISLYINYNTLKKLEKQEDILGGYLAYLDSISIVIEISNERFKDLKLKRAFESDDEIGFFFKQIEDVQKALNQFILKKENGSYN